MWVFQYIFQFLADLWEHIKVVHIPVLDIDVWQLWAGILVASLGISAVRWFVLDDRSDGK